jgi:hypothetical protein
MKRGFLAGFLLLLAIDAEAATYWVKAGTNSSCAAASGSSDPGFYRSTITNGLSCLAPGDTLNITSGSYAERIVAGTNIFTTQSGTSYANATTIQGIGTVTLNSSAGSCIQLSTPAAGTVYRYIVFKNFICDGAATSLPGTQFGLTIGGGANGGTIDHIKLDGLEVKNYKLTAVGVGGDDQVGTDLWVTGLSVHDNGTVAGFTLPGDPSPSYGHCFYVEGGGNAIFEYNICKNQASQGFQQYASNAATNNIYRNNWVENTGIADARGASAFGISNGDGVKIYNNTIINNQNGIGSSVANAVIYNNTLYNDGIGHVGPGCCYADIHIDAGSATVKNNLLYNNAINSIASLGGTLTQSNNLATSTDPFINAAAKDFRLKSTFSAAIDQGTANIAPGITIPACSGGTTTGCYNGTAPDIGAMETGVPTAGGGPPTITPNLTSVGAGAPILLTVDDDDVNERIEVTGDWIGIFAPGAAVPAGGVIDGIALFDWFYMNGSKTSPALAISDAVIPFTAPTTPGKYEFRFYQDNSNLEVDRLATAAFTVITSGIVMKFNISTLKIGPSVTWKIGTP